jgi:hypothetical protein
MSIVGLWRSAKQTPRVNHTIFLSIWKYVHTTTSRTVPFLWWRHSAPRAVQCTKSTEWFARTFVSKETHSKSVHTNRIAALGIPDQFSARNPENNLFRICAYGKVHSTNTVEPSRSHGLAIEAGSGCSCVCTSTEAMTASRQIQFIPRFVQRVLARAHRCGIDYPLDFVR